MEERGRFTKARLESLSQQVTELKVVLVDMKQYCKRMDNTVQSLQGQVETLKSDFDQFISETNQVHVKQDN